MIVFKSIVLGNLYNCYVILNLQFPDNSFPFHQIRFLSQNAYQIQILGWNQELLVNNTHCYCKIQFVRNNTEFKRIITNPSSSILALTLNILISKFSLRSNFLLGLIIELNSFFSPNILS